VLVLAFDTSTPAVTVAIVDTDDSAARQVLGVSATGSTVTIGPGPRPVAERTEVASNRHGELLAPLIEQVLFEAGATPQDLGAIAVGLGPGPFTGLRVGIVTAKALGDALGLAVYGECSLDVIGVGMGGLAIDDTYGKHGFVAMSDARRKQVYWAGYDYYGHRVSDPDIIDPHVLAQQLEPETYVVGAGATLYREVFGGFAHMAAENDYPGAAQLGRMVASRAEQQAPGDDLTPLYLRRPDAQPPGKLKAVTPA
jgi:tRNA threonylcarbamoyl adenosine modification protein YeaZ